MRRLRNLARTTIDGGVWHLDVGSSHPGAAVGPKGMAVRHLKWYASWVSETSFNGKCFYTVGDRGVVF